MNCKTRRTFEARGRVERSLIYCNAPFATVAPNPFLNSPPQSFVASPLGSAFISNVRFCGAYVCVLQVLVEVKVGSNVVLCFLFRRCILPLLSSDMIPITINMIPFVHRILRLSKLMDRVGL